ncbi:FHA domain-containing protein, partial [Pyxidicoccus fallax]|uniref:FHA domain-containing protein n=1 Tax=Pyxidicoccus fallax TaxID=394095 RepID=UPI001FE4F66E
PPRPPGTQAPKDSDVEVELPFDDDEVSPLRADDPRPQRVPQYPAGSRRSRRQGKEPDSHDRELASRFDWGHEYSDPGYAPAFLYVERGPGVGQLVPVKQGPMVMGRSSSSDLRLQHPSISRRHAQLTRRGDRFFLKDLSSQNGTFVNRTRVPSEVEVMPGDEISMGNAMLRLRGPGATPALGVPAVTATIPTGQRWTGAGSLKVALLAAVLGSAVAALVTLVAVSLSSDEEAPVVTEPGSTKQLRQMAPEPMSPEEAQGSTAQETGAREASPGAPAPEASSEPEGSTSAPTGDAEGGAPEAQAAPTVPAGATLSATDVARGRPSGATAPTPSARDVASGRVKGERKP